MDEIAKGLSIIDAKVNTKTGKNVDSGDGQTGTKGMEDKH